jgi:hypothetical protein
MTTNIGRWAQRYAWSQEQVPYGDTPTYQMAEDHLHGLAVEDWGCGVGWFRRFHDGPYLGVDATETQWSDVVDDLVTRVSETPGLLLRHVLEHNEDWPKILDNIVLSAQERLVIVTFAPDGEGETLNITPDMHIPDIAVPHATIDAVLTDSGWTFEKHDLVTETQYGTETIWLASRA